MSWVVAVPERLPDDQVREVVRSLVLRHEVLRTTFDADGDGRPRQSVHEDVLVAALPHIEDEQSRHLFVETPFDVTSESPIRFGRTSAGDLIFVVSHIAADGTGAWILVDELTELLAARAQRRDARLGADVPQPVDRACHERAGGRPRADPACGTGTPRCGSSL
ncbi:condensation domain-containing protein [Kutzneria sp. 744]|uniref:condensation domain-containing protein n=1 Tax=Kutzneria sp. (strain 744) TaxID=345341 RepID=UPI00350F77E4